MLTDFFLNTYAAIPAAVSRASVARVVATYLESFAAGDMAARETLFADDCIIEEPVGTAPIYGKDDLVAFWKATADAGWKVRNELQRLIVHGNEAAVLFRSVLEVEGQGSVSLDVFETLVFDETGRISRLRAYNDATCLA